MESLNRRGEVRQHRRSHERHRAKAQGIGRRGFLAASALGGLGSMTAIAHALARDAEVNADRDHGEAGSPHARSLILLWLDGGPSQFETFDPHPNPDSRIAGGTRAIGTAVPGVRLAEGLTQLAEQMQSISIVRSMVSKEGDHERGTYLGKTGYRPEPTGVHPTIGAICCHELPPGGTEIPRHISIMPGSWPSWGGYLGAQYDAFKTYDPAQNIPDVRSSVSEERDLRRRRGLAGVERAFRQGRRPAAGATMHRETILAAREMMSSDQLTAFDIDREPADLITRYGDTPFGRGCLAARRLLEVGVRCVEVTLSGWDSHINNHNVHRELVETLDPAFATLIDDLRERDMLDRTVVLCAGEFGRTPRINPLEGRDHWPHGFSVAMAGGGLRGGRAIGETDPEGSPDVSDPRRFADVHATILSTLGIDIEQEYVSTVGRPIRVSEGEPIAELLSEQT